MRPGQRREPSTGTEQHRVLDISAAHVLDTGPRREQPGRQEEMGRMFGWSKRDSVPTKAQLREAALKRLAEVLGLPDEDPAASEASPLGSFEPSLETDVARG